MISLIYAQSINGVIGKDGKIPWHHPMDMAYFKAMTLHKPVVMGRKTWESIPHSPLPNRENIVLTRDRKFKANANVFHSVESLENYLVTITDEIMIIGGAAVYCRFLPVADRIYRNTIEGVIDGDVKFPSVHWDEWKLVPSGCYKWSPVGDSPQSRFLPIRFDVLERA